MYICFNNIKIYYWTKERLWSNIKGFLVFKIDSLKNLQILLPSQLIKLSIYTIIIYALETIIESCRKKNK